MSGYSYRLGDQEDPSSKPSLSLFPNPVKEQLSFQIKNVTIENDFDVFIFDAMGSLVNHFKQSEESFSFDIRHFNISSGLYFIEVRVENEIFREKFIYAK